MGGYGALNLGMKHPEIFSTCATLSAAVRTDQMLEEMDNDRYLSFFQPIYGGSKNKRVTNYWKKNNVFHQLDSVPLEKVKQIRWYIDCGDDDYLSEGNCMLHIKMLNMKIPHEFRVREGAHTWEYWKSGIVPALQFIDIFFRDVSFMSD